MPTELLPERELLAMCSAGRLYDVERWIAAGRSLAVSGSGPTPLSVALQRGFHSLVELCLRHETGQAAKNAALAAAVRAHRADLAELAVRFGADVKSVPFADALYSWSRDIVTLFIEHGGDPVADHPFAWAFTERIRTVLGTFLDLRRTRPEFSDPLQLQIDVALRQHVREANVKWVSLLMWAGANPRSSVPLLDDLVGDGGDEEPYPTAMEDACSYGHPEVLKRMRPDANLDDLGSLLCLAAHGGHLECVRLLLSKGASLAHVSDGGAGAVGGCFRQMGWEAGWPFHLPQPQGVPPTNALETLKVLLDHGATWRPSSAQLRDVRQSLYRLPVSSTVDVLRALVTHRATDAETLKAFVRTPKMQERLKREVRALAEVGLALDGRLLPSASSRGGREQLGQSDDSHDREGLYREVWEEPLSSVAERHEMSEARLAAICRVLRIPTPGRGYWTRRNAGVPVPPPPALPDYRQLRAGREPRVTLGVRMGRKDQRR